LGSQLWGLGNFRIWFSRLGTWISHRGFRVAFGHGLPLVILTLSSTINDIEEDSRSIFGTRASSSLLGGVVIMLMENSLLTIIPQNIFKAT
jgi:hypothetical protein